MKNTLHFHSHYLVSPFEKVSPSRFLLLGSLLISEHKGAFCAACLTLHAGASARGRTGNSNNLVTWPVWGCQRSFSQASTHDCRTSAPYTSVRRVRRVRTVGHGTKSSAFRTKCLYHDNFFPLNQCCNVCPGKLFGFHWTVTHQ